MNTVVNFLYEYWLNMLSMVAIVGATIFLVQFLRSFTSRLDKKLDKKLEQCPQPVMQVPELTINATHYRFFKHLLIGLIYFLGGCLALSMVPPLRSVVYSVLAGSGVLSVILAFASREAFSNILSGFLIDIFRPFEVGNHIKIDKELEGNVKDITLSHTILKTARQNHIMVPNSLINSKTIENITFPTAEESASFDIYISYKADIDKVLGIIRTTLESHPLILDKRSDEDKAQGKPIVEVNVENLGLTSVHVRAWVTAKDEKDVYRVKCDSYRQVKKSFDAQHIPFPDVLGIEKTKELSL
jgi:small conductance mechanosensitive channel